MPRGTLLKNRNSNSALGGREDAAEYFLYFFHYQREMAVCVISLY
jgi:hypothetical protein